MAGDNGIQSINKDEHIVVGGLQAKQVLPFVYDVSNGTYRTLMANSSGQLRVEASVSIGDVTITNADGAILDGANANIRATVMSLPSGNPSKVILADSSGGVLSTLPVSLAALCYVGILLRLRLCTAVRYNRDSGEYLVISSLPSVDGSVSIAVCRLSTQI